jgi:hypothetical protein
MYVSRLKCVQNAVTQQLERQFIESPKFKPGLITFNNDVSVYGDGSVLSEIVCGDELNEFDVLIWKGEEFGVKDVMKNVRESKATLIERVKSFSEGGATGLGPGVLLAVGMASNNPGSKK